MNMKNSYNDDFVEPINYAFREDEILEEMQDYIDSTYSKHYSQGQYQSTEIIEDMGHGMGFALGNVIKYCQRYGKKEGFNRDDLKKVIHYSVIALAMHDRTQERPHDSETVFEFSERARQEHYNVNVRHEDWPEG